jgi:signal transduction histidine kinase
MRTMRIAVRFIALAWLLAALPAGACEALGQLTQAIRTIQPAGAAPATTTVTLPDHLDAPTRRAGHPVRYTFDVAGCEGTAGRMFWLFRVGAPYRIQDDKGQPLPMLAPRVSLRPALLGNRVFPPQEGFHNGRIPAMFALPQGARLVHVDLFTLTFIPSGIVSAAAGPTEAVMALQAQGIDRVVAHADAASGVVLVLGALAAALWSRRRKDRGLLWLAIACGLWGLRGLLYYGHEVYWSPLVFEQFNSLNVLVTSGALYASVLWLLRRPARWQLHAGALATVVGVGGVLLSMAVPAIAVPARALALLLAFLLVVALLVLVLQRRATLERSQVMLLVTGIVVLLACAAHDLMILAGARPPDASSAVFWGFVVLLTGFAAISGQYVVATLNRAERSNEALARSVAERERLLRDMHDGLGAQLMTTLRGVERGTLPAPQLAQSLQDSLEELRLLMDSTDMGEYLPAALAAWRNRWDARLDAAGISLHWRIDDALDRVQLSGDTTMQVMRILQEGAANIVKHAQARRMAFSAGMHRIDGADTLCIEISDDGIGLPAEADRRTGSRGLKNMRLRAQQIGARLRVEAAAAGGTVVRLEVPVRP